MPLSKLQMISSRFNAERAATESDWLPWSMDLDYLSCMLAEDWKLVRVDRDLAQKLTVQMSLAE